MDMDRLARTILELRPLVLNVHGFHDLATDASLALTPEKRAEYEAQARASAAELASRMLAIMVGIETACGDPAKGRYQARDTLRLVVDNECQGAGGNNPVA